MSTTVNPEISSYGDDDEYQVHGDVPSGILDDSLFQNLRVEIEEIKASPYTKDVVAELETEEGKQKVAAGNLASLEKDAEKSGWAKVVFSKEVAIAAGGVSAVSIGALTWYVLAIRKHQQK